MDSKIVSDINKLLDGKYKYANDIYKIEYISGNIKSVDKQNIIFLNNNIDRFNTINKFLNLLNNIDLAIKIEAGIFEYSLVYGTIKNLLNSLLISIYQDKIQELLLNIDPDSHLNNLSLKQEIMLGKINPQKLAFLKPYEIHPEHWKEYINRKIFRETKRSTVATTDLYTCPRCKHKKCHVSLAQTRSADEAMTTFLTCLNCYHRFKK